MSQGVDIFVTLTADTDAFVAAMRSLREPMRLFGLAVRRTASLMRPHRSGRRHRGTRGWDLRYAPARRDVPLGHRTMAKHREIT